MYVVCVRVQVLEGKAGEFLEETLANARATRSERDNVRFDVLQGSDDPNRFFLYEVYSSQAAFQEHQRTSHYLLWKEKVTPLMAAPRVGEKYESRFPASWA